MLGLGDSGLTMARWLHGHGARVTAADSRSEPPHRVRVQEELPDVRVVTGAFDDALLDGADMLAISPGVDRRTPAIARAIARGVETAGDIELFARGLKHYCDTRKVARPPVMAITGSNGKSTVTAMAGHACNAAGLRTAVAGNIGLPVLDVLSEIEAGAALPDAFALELSSFQLESTATLNADAATMLNLTEDHLDRYDGMADYGNAKARIFEGNGVQVLNRDDMHSMAMHRAGRRMETFGLSEPDTGNWGISVVDGERFLAHDGQTLLPVSALPVAGLHNAGNALAALALVHGAGLPAHDYAAHLKSFKGLSHRVEHIATVNGVSFYDDSKGTNVGATVAALNGMTNPVVLIAGGDGKGQDFAPLAPAVGAHARAVVLIGQSADAIQRCIAGTGVPVLRADSMDAAVETALAASVAGDAVLLSPACASFDMFRNYVHRAEVFRAVVAALERRAHGG